MKIRTFLILPLLILHLHAFSQPGQGGGNPSAANVAGGEVIGRVIDANTAKPIEYSTIAILSARDSSVVSGSISNPEGNFRIENIPFGRYIIRVQFIGYETKDIANVVLNHASHRYDAGEVKLSTKMTGIKGVEVTAQRAMIENNLDKRVINVDQNMAVAGGTATEVLENIPSISVDAEGNVSLRGSSNITILIDGKPTGIAELSSGEILQQLPATAIQSVEVITNPSVRYDPEGTAGIINIVLKKKALQGYNGQISANYGIPDMFNGSLNFNLRRNKINFFAGYDNRIAGRPSEGNSVRTSNFNGNNIILSQESEAENKRNTHNVNTGIDYLFDDFNTLTFAFQYRNMLFGNNNFSTSRQTFNNQLQRNFTRDTEADRKMNSLNYTLSYRRTFDTKNKELTADFMITDNAMNGEQYITQLDLLNKDEIMEQDILSNNNSNQYMAQANFVTPVGNGGRLETGFKSNMQKTSMRNEMLNRFNRGEWVPEPQGVNNFDYDQQVHAVYGVYSNSLDKLKYQFGLRFEQLLSNSLLTVTNDEFEYNKFDWFPSVHFAYDITPTTQTMLSYSKRIRRPWNMQLNPYIDYTDSLNIRQGNPELKPEYTHSLELGALKFWNKNSLNTTLFLRQTEGEIMSYTTLREGGVTYTTYINTNDESAYGLELVGSREFAKWFKANANVSIYNTIYSAYPELNIPRAESFGWTSRVNANFIPAQNLTFTLAGNYRSPRTEALERQEANYNIDASMRYDFLKDRKATFTMRVTDIFDTRRYDGERWGEDFHITSMHKPKRSRMLWVGLSYRLNNFKATRDRNPNQDEQEMDFGGGMQ